MTEAEEAVGALYPGEGELWRVVNADCLNYLMMLPDRSVHACVTDPPYCSGGFTEAQRTQAKYQGGMSQDRAQQDWFMGDAMGTAGIARLLRNIALELCRVLADGGSFLVFTDWRQVPNLAPEIETSGLRYTKQVIWDKGSTATGFGFRPAYECVLQFAKGTPKYYTLTGSDVIRSNRVPPSKKDHPTQKPVALMAELIRVVTPPGGVVLDPFAGACSTGVAAVEGGYRFIGVERDAKFCQIGRERLGQARPKLVAESKDPAQAEMFGESSE